MMMSQIYANRFIPKYCNKKLTWYDRNYDFIDLNKWEEFDKEKDFYIFNVNVTFFSKIYRGIGFRRKPSLLKKTVQFSKLELNNFGQNMKKSKTVDAPLIKQITDKNKRTEALSACFRTERKDIYLERTLILNHFRYLKEW